MGYLKQIQKAAAPLSEESGDDVQSPGESNRAGESQLENHIPADQKGPEEHRHSLSPLWLVTQEPSLNRFITRLQSVRRELEQEPGRIISLEFSRAELQTMRDAFGALIRNGERTLHQLSQLIADRFLGSYAMRSVVIGEVESNKERFTLGQNLSADDLYSNTDLDLGNRQLNKLRFHDGTNWSSAQLIANFVEYQPREANGYGIHRIISRIKAEEEIWNKVVDEIFDLDSIVLQDKSLRHLSRYVKDIFGLKIVVNTHEEVFKVQSSLASLQFSDAQLAHYSLPAAAPFRALEFVEVKNYLARAHRKRTGWAAMKSVVSWGDKTLEIQVQPLGNFLRERELLTKESHAGFKAKREQIRDEIAAQIPLFYYYRALLRWLFTAPETPPPAFPRLKVTLTP